MNDKGSADLEAEIHRLQAEVWTARDAAIGSTAALGAARARIQELESLIHQLRVELHRHEQEADFAQRMVRRVATPLRAVKRRWTGLTPPQSGS